jgi:DNA-binding PadR family transcriptional regulator
MDEPSPEPVPATEPPASSDPAPVSATPGPGGSSPASELRIASARDGNGAPIHRGWAQVGSHHRWMEPFVLALLANGSAHGYAIVGELAGLGITNGAVDVGQVYRTLRDLEQGGQVRSTWSTGTGPARRDYELTTGGWEALDEWASVMKERGRLVAEFDALYLQWVAMPRPSAG